MPVNIKTINRVNFDITLTLKHTHKKTTANEMSCVKVHYRIFIKIQLHHINDEVRVVISNVIYFLCLFINILIWVLERKQKRLQHNE